VSVLRPILRFAPLPALALGGLVLGAGCSDDDGTTQPVQEDVVPNTYLTVAPAEGADVSHRVPLRWTTNELPQAPQAREAAFYEIAWEDTTAWIGPIETTDSLFVTEANDTCCVPPLPSYATPLPDSVYSELHTFFVRGVSPGGKRDPSPAVVSFNAHTIAPTTTVTFGPAHDDSGCPNDGFGWSAVDPDGEIASYEWALVSAYEYRDALGSLPVTDDDVIAWITADESFWAASDSGFAAFTGLPETVTANDENRFYFAARAIDDGGATEKNVEAGRNLIAFDVRDLVAAGGPLITIIAATEFNPTAFTWRTGQTPGTLTVSRSSGVRFTFSAVPSTPCTQVADPGFAYSVDGGAFTSYATTTVWPSATEDRWKPAVGLHTFTVRSIDDAGQVRELTANVNFTP
jgi:hypothetical protein